MDSPLVLRWLEFRPLILPRRTNSGYGSGRYSAVTTRDIEDEDDFEKLSSLAMVEGIAPLSRLLLSPNLNSIKDLGLSVARLKIEDTPPVPLSGITLGVLTKKKDLLSSTTSEL